MATYHKLGILFRSIFQASLLIFVLDSMKIIDANLIVYLVISGLLFAVRFLITNQIMKKDIDSFYANAHSFSKTTVRKPEFSRMYTVLDPDRKIYIKNKNVLLYIFFNNEIFGIIDSEDDHNVEIRTTYFYYL